MPLVDPLLVARGQPLAASASTPRLIHPTFFLALPGVAFRLARGNACLESRMDKVSSGISVNAVDHFVPLAVLGQWLA